MEPGRPVPLRVSAVSARRCDRVRSGRNGLGIFRFVPFPGGQPDRPGGCHCRLLTSRRRRATGASGFRGRDRLPERFAGRTRRRKAVREPAFRPSLYSGIRHGRGLSSSSASSGRSRANQAAAIFSISRRMARSSRKRRISSPASLSCLCSAANVSGVRPCSRSARATQFRIACALGSNSRESSSGLFPCRTRSIICRWNSGEYRRPVPLIWPSSRTRSDGLFPPGA